MNVRLAFFGLMLTAFSLPAAAQDIAGKWKASLEGPQGEVPISFDFTVEGEELKGTMSNDITGEVPIAGKVAGNELSFKMMITGGPGGLELTLTYSGKLEDDKITLTMGIEGLPPGGVDAPAGGMPPLTLTRAEQ